MNSNKIIAIYVITALWDVVLRFMATGNLKVAGVEKMKWVVVLKEYFERHTLLSAALVAGFVGAVTELTLQYTVNSWFPSHSIGFVLGVVMVSGLIGLPMRYSKLFPHLDEFYYERLGFTYSFGTDAFSGFVVMVTYWLFDKFMNNYIV